MFGRLLRRLSTKKTTTPKIAETSEKQESEETQDTSPCNAVCLTKRTVSKNDTVPLKSVSVDVTIEGFIANVRSTLRYKNAEDKPIEVRYEFPMDDQSAVYQFEAQIEDRIIVAECQEREQAKETYDDALRGGFGAVLMQENDCSSDIFTCLVGNLPPDAEAVITFGYVTELSIKPDGTLCFLLPTLLNPRYTPEDSYYGISSSQDATKRVPTTDDQPYDFEIKATIVNPGKVVCVNSPKDELDVKLSEDKTSAQVTLAKPFVPDHDLTLNVTFEEPNKPHVILGKGDSDKDGILKKDVVMLNFFPELKESDYTNKHEIIFVVDRSVSMGGSRIKQAKEALLLFLKSLPLGCYFNIVGFGSSYELLFKQGSQEYCEKTLKDACEHQKKMDADLGGTEILKPLKHIYDKSPMATHCREILILTDGEVSNTEEMIDLVKKNASHTRLFSFGIGEGASTSLVKGIARAGLGTAEFTKSEDDRLQPLVMKTLKAALQPTVTDLHLDWKLRGRSCRLVKMPKEMPPVFAGDRLIVYAMTLKDEALPNGKVQLKGKIGKSSFEFEIELDASKNVSTGDGSFPIHRLAAKAQIKQLQDSGKDKNKASIVLLSTAANVISCHTSMVGVDKDRKQKVVGHMMRRSVPTMSDPTPRLYSLQQMSADVQVRASYKYPRSCRSVGRIKFGSFGFGKRNQSAPIPRSMGVSRSSLSAGSARACSLADEDDVHEFCYCASADDMDLEVAPKSEEPSYMTLVDLQTFSGQWILNGELAAAMNTTLVALQSAAPLKSLDVWATVLALTYLEVKFGDKRDEWEMVESKAKRWLDLQDREGHSVDDLMQKAKAAVVVQQ